MPLDDNSSYSPFYKQSIQGQFITSSSSVFGSTRVSLTRRPVGLQILGLPFCSASVSAVLILIFSHCSPQLCMPKSLEGGVSTKLVCRGYFHKVYLNMSIHLVHWIRCLGRAHRAISYRIIRFTFRYYPTRAHWAGCRRLAHWANSHWLIRFTLGEHPSWVYLL